MEGKYEASSLGRIKSVERKARFKSSDGGVHYRRVKERILSYKKTSKYRLVQVDSRVYAVHTLISMAWNGTKPGMQLEHINGDKDDNRPENIKLRSPKPMKGKYGNQTTTSCISK